LSKITTGSAGNTEKKEEKILWKKGSAYLTTKLIPVIPVVPAFSEFNSRLGLSKSYLKDSAN
jgi:hypothetical protein